MNERKPTRLHEHASTTQLNDGREVALKIQHRGIDSIIAQVSFGQHSSVRPVATHDFHWPSNAMAQDLDNIVYLAESMYEQEPK